MNNLDKTEDLEIITGYNPYYNDGVTKYENCVSQSTQNKTAEGDYVWLIDGYDFCNNLESPTLDNYQDVIHILKDDGGILELRNVKTFHEEGWQNETDRFIGLYYENAVNSNQFAIVEYDTNNNWPSYIRSNYNYADQNGVLIKPRKLKYYAGDGLEYVFREYVAPYGLREDIERKRGWVCDDKPSIMYKPKATIFYLEEINSSNTNLTKFKRNYHKPTENNFEITRGRSLVREFANHKISYSPFDIHIESFGKIYTMNLGYRDINWYRFTNTDCSDPVSIKENLYYPLQKEYSESEIIDYNQFYSFGMNYEERVDYVSKNIDEELNKPYKVPNGDGLYYVLKIIDPLKREISFDYQSVIKKMDEIPEIFDNASDFLYLHTFRLNQIITENKITDFEYKEDPESSTTINSYIYHLADTVTLDFTSIQRLLQ